MKFIESIRARRSIKEEALERALIRRGYGEVLAQVHLEGVPPTTGNEVMLLKAAVDAGALPNDAGFWPVITGALKGIREARAAVEHAQVSVTTVFSDDVIPKGVEVHRE